MKDDLLLGDYAQSQQTRKVCREVTAAAAAMENIRRLPNRKAS